MKNIFKIITIMIVTVSFISCDEDPILFDGDNGPTSLSFAATSFDIIVPEEDRTLEIPVNITTRSDVERTFNVSVNPDLTTPNTSNEYSIGQVVIPAGEFTGTLQVDFKFSEISGPDGEVKSLSFSITPEGDDFAFNETVSVEYFREIVCNDMELTIVSDFWATETSFSLQKADGEFIVEDFFPFSSNGDEQIYNVEFFLEDGDYIFTLFDAFGDGQVSTNTTGSYELKCSIITHASGSGELENGTFEATEFSVNP